MIGRAAAGQCRLAGIEVNNIYLRFGNVKFKDQLLPLRYVEPMLSVWLSIYGIGLNDPRQDEEQVGTRECQIDINMFFNHPLVV